MLSVLSVAYPFAPVSRDAVGGAEQVLNALDEALCRAGHRSWVVASSGSRVLGELLALPPLVGPPLAARRAAAVELVRARVQRALRELAPDVVHFHGCDCADYWPGAEGPPRVVSLHLPLDQYPLPFLREADATWICVSHTQRARAPCAFSARVIENGVPLDRLRPEPGARPGYAALVGRICEEKGFDEALSACKLADFPARLAGQVYDYPAHVRYFTRCIAPLLDGQRRFVGAIGSAQKSAFYAGAACTIIPSRIEETSSLVAMESLACGTPLIVSGRGHLPSWIEPGVTGFVADGVREIASCLARVSELDRAACRALAEQRCDLERCTADYLALYRRLAARGAERKVS